MGESDGDTMKGLGRLLKAHKLIGFLASYAARFSVLFPTCRRDTTAGLGGLHPLTSNRFSMEEDGSNVNRGQYFSTPAPQTALYYSDSPVATQVWQRALSDGTNLPNFEEKMLRMVIVHTLP